MIIKKYEENVLGKLSTHVIVKRIDKNDDSIVHCDLVIKEDDEVKEVLATDRYYNFIEIGLTTDDLAELEEEEHGIQ